MFVFRPAEERGSWARSGTPAARSCRSEKRGQLTSIDEHIGRTDELCADRDARSTLKRVVEKSRGERG